MSRASGQPSYARKNAIRKYIDWLEELPPSGESWSLQDGDIPDELPVKILRDRDVIKVVSQPNRPNNVPAEYEVTQIASQVAERAERYTPCPCGHAGFHNAGGYFECGFSYCDKRFTRDELEVRA